METRPLTVVSFCEIFGIFESETIPKETELINHRLYIKRNSARLLDELLHRSQVALFIDVKCLQTAQWIKGHIIQN